MTTLDQMIAMSQVSGDSAKVAKLIDSIKLESQFADAPREVIELMANYIVLRGEIATYMLTAILSKSMPNDPVMGLKIMRFGSLHHSIVTAMDGK